jgi:predicted membrane-bound spermidine synthase
LSPNGKLLDLFESLLIVFAASFAGMLLNIILIFNYQIQFGSLFLYFGLVVSLFMLGLFAGGWLMDFLLEKKRVYCRSVSFLTLLLGAFVFVFCLNPAHSQIYFAFLFFSSGFFLGIYVPFSAYQMKRLSIADRKASSLLDSLDHLAGAMGGLLSCVVFLPVLGEGRSFAVIFSLLAAICVMTFFFSRNDEESNKPGFLSAFLWIVAWALFLAFSFFLVWHSYVPGGKREAVSGGSEANSSANIQKLIRNGKLSSHEAMDFSE